jgi:hypothetical protein
MATIGQSVAGDNAPSRVERLLASVLLWAGVGMAAAVFAAGGWAFFNSILPLKPAPPVVVEKPSPAPPVVAEKPRLLPKAEAQPPADHPFVNEAEKPPPDPAVRKLLDQGWALLKPPYSMIRWQQARKDFENARALDAESNEARIGLAYIFGGKLSDEWSPVLQEETLLHGSASWTQ